MMKILKQQLEDGMANMTVEDKLKEVADKLNISFQTARKVHEGVCKNWRNAEVHGEPIREKIEMELSQ